VNSTERDPVVDLKGGCLALGNRVLRQHLDLAVAAGEFIAVLGPNGTGKTSLLKVLLGELPLTAGTLSIAGRPVTEGSRLIGYVPQHRAVDPGLTLRGRDMVGLGLDGHRWGLTSLRSGKRTQRREAVAAALGQVNADRLADTPVGVMSGGELQRVRVAQALASDPSLLLCDEPLLNLDPANARLVSSLIDRRRRDAQTAVLFVTHEVNPVLPFVNRILYLVDGRFRIGTVDEVMTSDTLSELYRADIQVVKIHGRYVVVGEHIDHSGHTSGHSHE
jgi:zinc/manganese transport system ATP-binding protein